jgi:SAM-dependent methyltransferase
MWIPRFACPECGNDLHGPGDNDGSRYCEACHRRYELREGIWRFLSAAQAADAEPFARQYRSIREREGYRTTSAEYYRRLPEVAADDPHATEWRIRHESYEHLLAIVRRFRCAPLRVLDLGAGNGWLSNRLASRGHDVCAVDRMADEADGLGASRHYASRFTAVQASFDALPFAPAQFDVVVFNGSLHYAADVAAALASARRLLADGGTLAVMDSPMFDDDRSGRAMVADMVRRFESDYGIRDVVRTGTGYLTFGSLAHAATTLGARGSFIPSRGPVVWRVRRGIARLRLGRSPAAFGVWVAR